MTKRLTTDEFAEFLISLGLLSECSSPSELLEELEYKEVMVTNNNSIYRIRKVGTSFNITKEN